ncbi:hypothetical protein ACHAXT_002893 [Thalassiosira profunda]
MIGDDKGGDQTHSTGVASSFSPSIDRQRSNRIKHKKRNVALHAEYRERQDLLAPPLVTEHLMEDTDNVFSGQDLGVETMPNNDGANASFDGCPRDLPATTVIADIDSQPPIKYEKTLEENAFLDKAIDEDDNFNHLLIKKGDEPDYLYLILEGEIAVYIDPNEYIDENAVETGKHAPLDIALKTASSNSLMSFVTGKSEVEQNREFKQSYVLNLRKSLFSSYKENEPPGEGIVGQVLSVVRDSFTGKDSHESHTSMLSNIMEDPVCRERRRIWTPSFIPLNELRGLKHERDLGPFDVLGELGLVYNCPRTASCLTTTNCILYRVNGEVFRQILASSNADRVRKRCVESKAALETLYNIGVFEELDAKTVTDLEYVMNPLSFERDDLVITKGTRDDVMFFVMSGRMVAHDIGTGDSRKADIELGEGGHYGSLNLLTGRPSIANVTVVSPKARLMAVTKKDYEKRRKSLEPLMRKLWLRNALLSIPVISKSRLQPHEINRLVQMMEKVSFAKGNVTQTLKSGLYLLETGAMQMLDNVDDTVHTFVQYDHFGGRSLFDEKFFGRKTIQVRAVVPTECMMLTRQAIIGVIGRINRLGKPSLPVSRKLIKGMRRSDLQLHRIIGVGMFGRVWLCQRKVSDTVYALKVMDKKSIIEKKMVKGVLREKNVMSSVEHPFLSDLVSTFQDGQSVYMLMSYVQGGELFGLIYNVSKKGYLSNDAAAFYGACLLEAISHLHSRSICHRDGYVTVCDFGFAKVVLDKTYTTCGSPEYMAPEILLGKGHSLSVDHWALGVLIYEMLVGQTPFIHVGATRMTLFRRICNGKFAFPNPKRHGINVSDQAKLLIRGLLNKDCAERMGSSITLGDEELSSNPFFQGLLTEYRRVFLAEKVTPPWLPDIDNALDASYFGTHGDLEKEVLSKKKDVLDKRSQRLFEGF